MQILNHQLLKKQQYTSAKKKEQKIVIKVAPYCLLINGKP